MIAYKGFDSNFSCRGFKYEVGETYVMEREKMQLCRSGFHACLNPIDVFGYYCGNARFALVEIPDDGYEKDPGSSKVVSHKIKIVRELSPKEMADEAGKWIMGHEGQADRADTYEVVEQEYSRCVAGNRHLAIGGLFQQAVAGEYGVAQAKRWGVAMSGTHGISVADSCGMAVNEGSGIAVAGDFGVAACKENGRTLAGEHGVAVSQNGGLAEAGMYGCAVGKNAVAKNRALAAGSYAECGDNGVAVANRKCSAGSNGLAVARGQGFLWAKGGMGAVLLFQKEADGRVDTRMIVIDGEKWKADTWYVWRVGDDMIREQ